MNEYIFNWILNQNSSNNKIIVHDKEQFFNSSNFFHTLLEFIQDGVSVLDTNLIVVYVNATISNLYTRGVNPINRKCYSVYHQRKTPCEDCPTLRAIKTKKPQVSTISYPRENNTIGWHDLFSIPVFDKDDNIILIIEYIRDVTFQKYIKDNLNDIENRFKSLEEKNNMLTQILNQREEFQNNLESTISKNLEKFIKPLLNYLKKNTDKKDIDLISAIIDEIIYPITKKRPNVISNLTPRELQIASLIKEGYQSKEIADKLFVTQKAIDYHRLNIRKKLNLDRNINLRTYLEKNL
jgi:DNA-binding CsgD family transcriptional regulator